MRVPTASSEREAQPEGFEDGVGDQGDDVVERERALGDVGTAQDRKRQAVEEGGDLGPCQPPIGVPLGGERADVEQSVDGPVHERRRVPGQFADLLGGDHLAVHRSHHARLLGPGEHLAQPRELLGADGAERAVAEGGVHHVSGFEQAHQRPGVGQAQVALLGEPAALAHVVGQDLELLQDGGRSRRRPHRGLVRLGHGRQLGLGR